MTEDAPKQCVGRSRIASDRRVRLSPAVCRAAGVAPGDVVRVEVAGPGRLVLTSIEELVDCCSGILATGGELRQRVGALRAEG